MKVRHFLLLLAVAAGATPVIAQLRVVGGNNFDFGKIYQTGAKVNKVIVVQNVGKSEIRISNVHTSCGCTAALLSDSAVSPGHKTEIKIQFDPTGYIGGVTKYIYIMNSDTVNSLITVRLTGYVAYAIQPTPSYVVINGAVINRPDSTTVTLSNTSDETFSITNVVSDSKDVSFKLDKKSLKPGEFTDLVVYIKPHMAGEISGFIHVYTTSRLQPELQLRLVAAVIGR